MCWYKVHLSRQVMFQISGIKKLTCLGRIPCCASGLKLQQAHHLGLKEKTSGPNGKVTNTWGIPSEFTNNASKSQVFNIYISYACATNKTLNKREDSNIVTSCYMILHYGCQVLHSFTIHVSTHVDLLQFHMSLDKAIKSHDLMLGYTWNYCKTCLEEHQLPNKKDATGWYMWTSCLSERKTKLR